MVRSAHDVAPTAGAIDRRRLLRAGGLSVVGATLLTACKFGPSGDEQAVATTPTTAASPSDIAILQAASTLEALAVEVYERATGSGILVTPAVAAAAELFAAHHGAHRTMFTAETSKLGGDVPNEVNSTLRAQLGDRINAMANEEAALRLVLDIEGILAATYQANGGSVDAATLRTPILSVGGVEARHATVISAFLGEPLYPDSGFQSTDGAISP